MMVVCPMLGWDVGIRGVSSRTRISAWTVALGMHGYNSVGVDRYEAVHGKSKHEYSSRVTAKCIQTCSWMYQVKCIFDCSRNQAARTGNDLLHSSLIQPRWQYADLVSTEMNCDLMSRESLDFIDRTSSPLCPTSSKVMDTHCWVSASKVSVSHSGHDLVLK